jgi:hypothetical protein
MTFNLDEAVAVLARTPVVLDALLRDLPRPWIIADEGEATWSPRDVVAHLVHGEETDWIPRARIILEHGEARPTISDTCGRSRGSWPGAMPRAWDRGGRTCR